MTNTAAALGATNDAGRHNMRTNPIARKIEQMVAAYFEACKMQDAKVISECFAPGATHYLPHLPPLHGGATIGNAIVNDLRNRGGSYFIDKIKDFDPFVEHLGLQSAMSGT
jgi:hypothetical protein